MSKILTYTAMTALLGGLTSAITKVQVPWIQQFSDVPKGTPFCILAVQSGAEVAGMYTAQPNGSWALALALADLNNALAAGSSLEAVINVTTSQTFAAPLVVFLNGQVVSNGAVATSTGTYVIVTPAAVLGGTYTVATLPAAATAGKGTRAFVSDATSPTFGATVVGSGAVAIPVYSDGTNWKVG